MTSYWHPFADGAAVEAAGELSIVRAEGSHIWDADGRRYLDATASLWYCNVGHGRPEIGAAVAEQMRSLESYSTFQDLTNPAVSALADRVAAIAPMADAKVFLTSGGSDSIDTATKMVRRYWQLLGQPERTILLRRERAYHGMHVGGTSLAGIAPNAAGYGPLLPDVEEVAWDDAGALRTTIERLGADRVAAFFCEPVIGAGGVYAPPPGYLEEARAVCRETGVLFVADEVITGFGRTGEWFASTRWGLDPDLVTCAKGITSGYLPLGAVLVAPSVWGPFFAEGAGMFRHGYTYSGHAAVAAAALANLDLMVSDDILARGRRAGGAPCRGPSPAGGSRAGQRGPRGHRRVGGRPAGSGAPARRRRLGRPGGAGVPEERHHDEDAATGAIQISPPLVLADDEVDELAAGLGAALDEIG